MRVVSQNGARTRNFGRRRAKVLMDHLTVAQFLGLIVVMLGAAKLQGWLART